MKISISILFIILVVCKASAQYEFDLGLKAGLHNSKITVNTNQFTPESIKKFHIGAFARFNLNTFYFQPEAYFSTKGGNVNEIVSYNLLQTVSSFNYDVIDVPALIGLKLINGKACNVRFFAGPVFSFVTGKSIDSENAGFNIAYFKDRFMGWQYGVGADFLMLTFDARIENSSDYIYTSSLLKSKNNLFLLTLGIKLL